EDSDQTKPFRQRRYFYYLSGVDEPDCALTYDIQSETLTLYLPPVDPTTYIWNGKALTIEAAKATYDVDDVRRSGPLSDNRSLIWQDVSAWISNTKGQCTIYCLHKNQEPYRCRCADSTMLQSAMDRARVRKDTHEIELIRKANEITAAAHREVLRKLGKFKNETEIQAAFLDACVARDAKHQAYSIIAASGENNSILHYVGNDQTLAGKQLALLDAGCEWDCYASDVTRTFPLSGSWPSAEAKAIYDLVDLMQTSCIERLKPGVHFLELYYLAQRIAINGLLQLGILHGGTPEDIFEAHTILAFFPHGLGHHLGLEVHDVSGVYLTSHSEDNESNCYSQESCYERAMGVYPVPNTRPHMAPCTVESPSLEDGMVITVEPGIYFNRYALRQIYLPSPVHSKYIDQDVLKRYLPVGGVRIEDDILITHNGYENLTTAPKGEEMVRMIQGTSSKARTNNDTNPEESEPPMVIHRETNNDSDNLERTTNLLLALGISLELVSPADLDLSQLSHHICCRILNKYLMSTAPSPGPDQERTRQLLLILGIDLRIIPPADLDLCSLVDELLRQISCQCSARFKTSSYNRVNTKNDEQQQNREALPSEAGSSIFDMTEVGEDENMPLGGYGPNNEVTQSTDEEPPLNPRHRGTKLDEYKQLLEDLEDMSRRRKQMIQEQQETLRNQIRTNESTQPGVFPTAPTNPQVATVFPCPPQHRSDPKQMPTPQFEIDNPSESCIQQLKQLERMNTIHCLRAKNETKRCSGHYPEK
ncbi:MAG: hypothetical protein M1835_002435, partial [Candelina submexicana]